jgi:hypothetical protein
MLLTRLIMTGITLMSIIMMFLINLFPAGAARVERGPRRRDTLHATDIEIVRAPQIVPPQTTGTTHPVHICARRNVLNSARANIV